MRNLLHEGTVSKIASFDGVDVYKIGTDKFKTSTINVFFHEDLDSETVTKNALVPAVLRRGCERFPTFKEIALYLEELYGASFDCGVTKKGERHIIQFYIEFVSDMFVGNGTRQFEKSFELLYEIITRPVLENGVFKEEYVRQEKANLKQLIESRANDKMQYAVDKCLEEMCRNEPYGIYDYGSISDLEHIDSKNLYQHYIRMLKTYPVQVYITGSVSDENLTKVVEKLKGIRHKDTVGNFNVEKVSEPLKDSFSVNVKNVRNVVERFNVNQGKLSLGFRTNTRPDSKEYYALMVCNGILGGGVHSKLFQNVREKASLAYYAFSRLEKFKGLMVISSGIEIKNKDRALEIMLQQIDEMKAGNITDYEFESTLKTIRTGVKSLMDNQLQIVDYYLSQSITNTNDSFDDLIRKTSGVSMQEVIEAANRIKLDTVYFLTSKSRS